MKRLALGIVLGLLYSTLVAAQTCTPVRLGKDANYSETTPGINFVIDSVVYHQKATVNLPPETMLSLSAYYFGYVNVYAGYNGCNQAWSKENAFIYIGLYDLTTGHWVFDSPELTLGDGYFCGKVPSCVFNIPGDYYNVNVIPGHHYHLWAFMSEETSVGTTAWESDYVTINVQ